MGDDDRKRIGPNRLRGTRAQRRKARRQIGDGYLTLEYGPDVRLRDDARLWRGVGHPGE